MFTLNFKQLAAASLVALTSVSAIAGNDADDRIEATIIQDKNYPTLKQQAITKLQNKGYQVIEIDADTHFSKPALSVEAYKGGQEYDIKLAYPSLDILKEQPER